MHIYSPVFTPDLTIPDRYTCDGRDVSPPLIWSGIPDKARSLVLIVDDPDAPDPAAPRMVWVHWVLYNLPTTSSGLVEAATLDDLPAGTREGINDWKRTGYGGPCPPVGRHRYYFRLFALDTVLSDLHEPSKTKLLQAMQGHVLAEADMVGTYQH